MENKYPFTNQETEEFSGHKKIHALPKKPSSLLRHVDNSSAKDIDNLVRDIKELKEGLAELATKYNILTVKTDFIIGSEKNKFTGNYSPDALVEKINGENLLDIKNGNLEFLTQVKSLIGSLLNYIEDKFETAQDALDDIYSPEQFVYGTTSFSDEPKIYLVDVSLARQNYKGETNNFSVIYDLNKLIKFCKVIEANNSNANLSQLKSRIKKVVNRIRKNG